MPGWSSRARGPRSRKVPIAIARKVYARDGHTCQIRGPGCLGRADAVDHIRPVFEGGGDELPNLRCVCRVCHAAKTQSEAQRARMRVSRKRPPPPRPGLLPG